MDNLSRGLPFLVRAGTKTSLAVSACGRVVVEKNLSILKPPIKIMLSPMKVDHDATHNEAMNADSFVSLSTVFARNELICLCNIS